MIVDIDYEPRWYQFEFEQAMERVNRAVLVYHRRCISGDARITMSDGSWKFIKDIRVGDQVLSWDGERVVSDTVLKTWDNGIRECVSITNGYKSTIDLTPDHEVAFVHSATTTTGWRKVSELKRVMLLDYPNVDIHPSNSNLTPVEAEFIGYMISDGSSTPVQCPKFTNTNHEIITRFAQVYTSLFHEEPKCIKKGNGVDLILSSTHSRSGITPSSESYSNPVKLFLDKLGLLCKKCDKRIPKQLFSASYECKTAFLLAYISADGAIYTAKNNSVIKGKVIGRSSEIKLSIGLSENMAWDMYYFLRSMGIFAKHPVRDYRYQCYYVRIQDKPSIHKVLSFGPVIGKTEKQSEALENCRDFNQRKTVKGLIQSTHKVSTETKSLPVYDITTEKYHNYFANNFLVHNCGKDFSCWNFLIFRALQTKGVYYYLFPTFSQAKKVIWDGIAEGGKSFIGCIPKQCIKRRLNNEMKLELINGSIIQMIGTDNYDSIRGTNPIGCVFSEYAMQDPRCWENVISPILRKNGGWAVFNSTPMGKNHFYEMLLRAEADPENWYSRRLTVDDTGLITPEQIEQERREGRTEEIIQQEFFVSFSRGVEGSYYGRMIAKIRVDDRITTIPYDSNLPVHTFWDLGYGDSTSIIFAQLFRSEVRVIDYYENAGEGLAHYAKVLQDKGYRYGNHWAPHDVESGSLATGMSLRRQALDIGIDFNVVPRTDINYGIELARALESRLWFDKNKCNKLIALLESYRKKFNDKLNVYSNTPLHDYTSHAADAFRYMAVALSQEMIGGLTAERIQEMKMRAQYS